VALEHASCPSEIVDAPVDVVWGLLTEPSRWGEFFDVRIVSVEPQGAAAVGQIVQAESGPRFLHLKVSFTFRRIDVDRHELEIDVRLPLGVKVHEELDCRPIDGNRCRVNYHCKFGFADGWRGRAAARLLGGELETGPHDSLRRLKRAAEARSAADGTARAARHRDG
jgi:hypothetical protein